MFKSNISFAEKQLLSYLPKTGKYYEANRNYSEDGSNNNTCLLYTSPSPRDGHQSRMPSSA